MPINNQIIQNLIYYSNAVFNYNVKQYPSIKAGVIQLSVNAYNKTYYFSLDYKKLTDTVEMVLTGHISVTDNMSLPVIIPNTLTPDDITVLFGRLSGIQDKL